MSAETTAYISLGSNLGDRERYLRNAVDRLRFHRELRLLACSGLYETEPVGYTDQPRFLNMAASLRTSLSPHALLHLLQNVENLAGRTREIRWGPRTLDLDLLWMDGCATRDAELTLPHPEMTSRAFVLVPLLDVLTDDAGLSREFVAGALEKLDGKEEVKLWKRINWLSASAPFES